MKRLTTALTITNEAHNTTSDQTNDDTLTRTHVIRALSHQQQRRGTVLLQQRRHFIASHYSHRRVHRRDHNNENSTYIQRRSEQRSATIARVRSCACDRSAVSELRNVLRRSFAISTTLLIASSADTASHHRSFRCLLLFFVFVVRCSLLLGRQGSLIHFSDVKSGLK